MGNFYKRERRENSIITEKKGRSRGHLVRFSGVKSVARRGELVRHDIAEIHEVVETLLEGISCGGFIYNPLAEFAHYV